MSFTRYRAAAKRVLARLLPAVAIDAMTVLYWRARNALSFPYEPERDRLAAFIAPGDWVVAAGVNMGQYASHLKQLVGRDGKVIGFEASTATFRLARRILGGTYELHPLALGRAPGPVTIARYRGDGGLINTGISRISTPDDPAAAELEQVECVRLDDVLAARHRAVTFIRCDVEGAEVDVLAGSIQVLAADHPTLLVEIEQPDAYLRMTGLLAPLGYTAHRLSGARTWQVADGFRPSASNNYLFVPRHKLAQVAT